MWDLDRLLTTGKNWFVPKVGWKGGKSTCDLWLQLSVFLFLQHISGVCGHLSTVSLLALLSKHCSFIHSANFLLPNTDGIVFFQKLALSLRNPTVPQIAVI